MRARVVFASALATLLSGCIFGRAVTQSFEGLFDTPRAVPHRITQPVRRDARLAALWVGHATVLVQIDDKIILTDPVFTSTVGQISKREVEPGIDVRDVPKVDAVLISHMHYDHLSLGSLEMLEDRIVQLFVPEGGLVYVPNYAFDARELSTWQSWEGGGLRVTAVPVQHVGFRYGVDSAWMTKAFTGYVVEYHGLRVYFPGDTGYNADDVRATASAFPHIDLALLPIAPVQPHEFMKHNHMNPAEAVRSFLELGARRMVPIHYDTFINSFDQPGDARRALQAAMIEQGLGGEQVAILDVGEQRVFVAR